MIEMAATLLRDPEKRGALALTLALIALAAGSSASAGTTPDASRGLSRPAIAQPARLLTPPPLVVPAPGGTSSAARPLPPLPPPPVAGGAVRRPRSASGATFTVAPVSGCSGNASSTVFPVGCVLQVQAVSLPTTGNHQDYIVPAWNGTPSTMGGSYSGATGGVDYISIVHYGTFIVASLNLTTNQWDAIVYLTAGVSLSFDTFGDSFLKIPRHTFTDDGSTPVYINATGLTTSHHYVVTIESTSVTGRCVFIGPTPSSLGTSLCNPNTSNVTGANPNSSGSLTVTWTPAAGLGSGTYSVSLFDQDQQQPDSNYGERMGQRQIALVSPSNSSRWSLVPTGGNPSPNPAPAGTPSSVFDYDGSSDQSDKQITAAVGSLAASHGYIVAVSDPNGAVQYHSTINSSGAGTLSFTWPFSNQQTPSNYIQNVYTLSLQDAATSGVVTTAAFQILGYSAAVQFTSPPGTAISIATGSVTSGMQFTNNGASSFGTNNADALQGFDLLTPAKGMVLSLNGSTSCGTNCQTLNVVDSQGQTWVATNVCLGGCGSGNAQYQLTLLPQTPGQSLAVGQSIAVSSITFTDAPGGHCTTSGCALTTTILPVNGLTWSSSTSTTAANLIYLTNGSGTSYAGTGHIALIGYDQYGTTTAGPEGHYYTPRFKQAVYESVPSFPAQAQDVFAYTVSNTSSAGSGSITKLQVTLPASFNNTNAQVDGGSPANWSVITCPTSQPANVMCFAAGGGNTGIAPGTNQTLWFDVNAPTSSFSFTDVLGQAITPSSFTITADGTSTVFVGSTNPQTVDSTALASYSLLSNLMTGQFSPSSVGTGSHAVSLTLQNTSTSQDPFPDYLDAVVIQLPTANSLSSITTSTPGWIYEGTTSPGGGYTDYWFGVCSTQATSGNTPPNDGLPACTTAQEQSALVPGATLTVSATINAGTSPGTIQAAAFAHGANGGGWSNYQYGGGSGTTFSLTVSSLTAAVGFNQLGTYGSPTLVPVNTTPAIGADSDLTYGNSYVYAIQNTGSVNVTSATITVPGTDTAGGSGADSSGQAWQITSVPTLSGSGFSGCSVTSYASATAPSTNGSIAIGGASCALTPGSTMYVSFSAKAPYKVNDTYQFSTRVTGGGAGPLAASERWWSDSDVNMVLTGNVVVTLDPTNPGPGGSTPAVGCTGCTFNTGTNTIDFGTVPNNTTTNYTDVVRVSVYTDAASPIGWQLYAVANVNPARAPSTPTNEGLTWIDSATSGGLSGMTLTTTPSVIPTSGNGVQLIGTSGTTARRLPFDAINSYQVNVGTEVLAPANVTVTFTWIAN
ncbi:hypothetical protein EPN52_07050 [bacterium]|nr:MAG: hypothetical protein EPN52_07050 [bacterium]